MLELLKMLNSSNQSYSILSYKLCVDFLIISFKSFYDNVDRGLLPIYWSENRKVMVGLAFQF